jgi:hypothetical protein
LLSVATAHAFPGWIDGHVAGIVGVDQDGALGKQCVHFHHVGARSGIGLGRPMMDQFGHVMQVM